MQFNPHPYQTYAINRIVNEKHVGLLLDMGLGKTVIVLSAIQRLIREKEIRKVLVIAPKKVAEATWQTEASKWDHLQDMSFSTVMGTRSRRRAALAESADIYIINRENVVWLCKYMPAMIWDFDMIVFDESSSFKNPGTKRFKAIRKELMMTRRTVILTGTPTPNGLEDLWAQIYLLDRGERLGKNYASFLNKYFSHLPWEFRYSPYPHSFDTVQRLIQDICVSMKAEDYLQLPEMVTEDRVVAMTPDARRFYRQTKETMVMGQEGTDKLTVLNAATLVGKLLQICGGAVYVEDNKVQQIHRCKEEALSELVEGLNGASALVFYGYKHEIPRIYEACKKGGALRIRELKTAADVEAWNAGEVDILIAHPSNCSFGLNLQDGGHHIIWFTLTWNLELYQQANARLHRQGQQYPTIVHRLLIQDGIDREVVRALDRKQVGQEALLSCLKAHLNGTEAKDHGRDDR